jgi:hypothetical protein
LLLERKALLLDLIPIRIERVAYELGDVGFAKVVFLATRLDTREVENVID